MSVLGSVLAVVIALSVGITNSFWAGCWCYARGGGVVRGGEPRCGRRARLGLR
jgi:hypothetical protein